MPREQVREDYRHPLLATRRASTAYKGGQKNKKQLLKSTTKRHEILILCGRQKGGERARARGLLGFTRELESMFRFTHGFYRAVTYREILDT